jgi:electron transport complex protein RnfD
MLRVILALLPGLLVTSYFLGYGVLLNVLICLLVALGLEALVLKIRGMEFRQYLLDGSAVITALLIALGLPADVPWYVAFTGVAFAILMGKHVFGGLGYNLFNPAMVGYAVILVCFPVEINGWSGIDGLAGATPLEHVKTGLTLMSTMGEMAQDTAFGVFGGQQWEWINVAFLLGGVALIYMRIISWHIPVAFLSGLFLTASLFFILDADMHSSPLFNLFSGAVMVGAFFVATDPVTAPTTNRGRLIFGALVGVLDYLIRTWGRYPDGLAFAILIMNAAAPLIEHYTQPRVLGQGGKS